MLEGRQGQTAPQGRIQPSRRQGRQEGGVLGGVREHGHIAMVLGGGPHHRRPTDINRLDRGLPIHRRVCNGLAEGIKVDHHHIDGGNRLGLQVGPVAGIVPAGKDAAMDAGMEGLHPTPQDLRGPGVISHPGHRQACGGQGGGGAATR